MDNALSLLSEPDRRVLLQCAERTVHARNDTIVAEGSYHRAVYLICSGAVRAERASFGRGVTVARLGPGDSFGEISLLGEAPATATLIADEERVEIDRIEGSRLDTLLDANPRLSARLYQSLASAFAQRLRDLAALLPLVIVDHVPQADRSRTPRLGHAGSRQLPDAVPKAVEDFKAELLRAELAIKDRKVDDERAQEWVDRACGGLMAALQQHATGNSQQHKGVGAYVFRETFPFWMRSASIDRWFTKPRGYAGDYFSIEIMYENRPQGDGRLGRFIDRYALNTPSIRAVRNRRRLVAEAIREVAAQNSDGGPTLVTSLASGPAREVIDVLAGPDAPDVRATCIDIDPEALGYASELAGKAKVLERITFAQDNVIHLAQGRGKTTLAPQHMIYSIGLIDYLHDKYVIALLDWIHEQLLPGGTAVLGNFDVANPGRAFMEHMLEWHLVYRTADDLRRLFARSKFADAPVDVRVEEEGINLFAFCTKESTLSQPFHQTGTFAVFTG